MAGASLTASILLFQVAVLPLVFKYCKCLQRKMVFTNCINYPRNLDYTNPSSCNMVGARNFTVDFYSDVDNCNISLGVWHIVPCSLFKELFVIRKLLDSNERLLNELKTTKNTVVLYCHGERITGMMIPGNCNHRASPHRLSLYKIFQKLNYHVVTFDYRGYGDSTYVQPTERGLVEDTMRVYSWILQSINQCEKPMVVIWGHSLGTAVAAHLVAHLSQLCGHHQLASMAQPNALILEAPFNNLIDEIECHPFSKLVSWLPYYKATFLKPFTKSSEYTFTTDQYLMLAPDVPILILHSMNDKIVPYELAVKLYNSVVRSRQEDGSKSPVLLRGFDRGRGLGHNNLCQAPDLPHIVSNFVQFVKKSQQKESKYPIKICTLTALLYLV